MKSALPIRSRSIEPLESRIAPAVMRIGATPGIGQGTGNGGENLTDTEYREFIDITVPGRNGSRPDAFDDLNFIDTSAGGDLISSIIDPSDAINPEQNTFYLRLKGGDVVFRFTSVSGYKEFITVKSGEVVAMFTDLNGNNDYDDGELTGLALGRGASVDINGEVNGDITTALDDQGTRDRADDTINLNGVGSERNTVTRLAVLGGSISGSILSGGDIKSLTIFGNVESVLGGTAATGETFDFFKTNTGERFTASFTLAPGKTGASIKNVIVDSISGRIEAGSGGFGGKGGAIDNVQVVEDTDGFLIQAGHGGDGDAAARRINGGAGGVLSRIYISGLVDGTPNSPIPMTLQSGDGGDAATGGRGGSAGAVNSIFVGYSLNAGRVVESNSLLFDSVLIAAGDGGSGTTAGAGGSVTNAQIRLQVLDVQGDEIVVSGGRGGDSLVPRGKSGAGGSVSNILIRNQIESPDSDILLQGGNAGSTSIEGRGGNGGSVSNATLLGFDIQLLAGAGSDGKTGGNGGSVNDLRIIADDKILNRNLLLNAGRGGNGSAGNGGHGGQINRVTVTTADYEAFIVNSGASADGGLGIGGNGGNGGSVNGISVLEIDGEVRVEGAFMIETGNGGDGSRKGGSGGDLTNFQIPTALDSTFTGKLGDGGDGLVSGNGGAGGSARSVTVVLDGNFASDPVSASLTAGIGGDGRGSGRSGGAGGGLLLSNLVTAGDARLFAGDGGNGQVASSSVRGGRPGVGGNVLQSGIFARDGEGIVEAGDAGINGAGAANGGAIQGNTTSNTVVGVRASETLFVRAGDGSHGGAGGDIRLLSFGSTSDSLTPTPSGSISILAGNGSADGKAAGRGGSIISVNGALTSGIGETTLIRAGAGGGDIPLLTTQTTQGSALLAEVQALDLSDVVTVLGSQYSLTFAGQTTSLLAGTSTASEVEAALNALPGINALNGVTVSATPTGLSITFNSSGDQPAITGTALLSTKGGDGGSVDGVSITRGGAVSSQFILEAGHGGSTARGTTGAKGGYVREVGMNDLDNDAVVIRSFAAGDGGDAQKRGGLGGSVSKLFIDHDIGVRTGLQYGYDSMGGIFAGLGGSVSTLSGKAGVAGSVTEVTAPSISAIVAGRSLTPGLAEKVSVIYLSGTEALLQENNSFFANGSFVLSFDADGPGGQPAEDTQLLAGNANAVDVQNALNALQSISAAGGITVGFTTDGAYQITFNNPGNQFQITGIERDPGQVTETIRGTILDLTETEVSPGLRTSSAVETFAGSTSGNSIEIVPGQLEFFTTEIRSGDPNTTPPTTEVQQLNLSRITNEAGAEFILNFNGDTTNRLPKNITASELQTALNALTSIQAAGRVTVLPGSIPNTFDIAFNTDDAQPPILGSFFIQETQRVDVTALANQGNSTFTLTFDVSTLDQLPPEQTAPIANDADAAAVAAALNLLPQVAAVGGVVVTGSNRVFDIKFGNIGNQPALQVDTQQSEVQTFTVDTTLPAGSEFTITHEGETTMPLAIGASAAEVDAALELLTTIVNDGGVTVTTNATGGYVVTFGNPGDQAPLVINLSTFEIQSLDIGVVRTTLGGEFEVIVEHFVSVTEANKGTAFTLPVIETEPGEYTAFTVDTTTGTSAVKEVQSFVLGRIGASPNHEFTMTFGNSTTPRLSSTITADQLNTALNSLVSVVSAGGVTVTAAAGGFRITFDANGARNQFEIDAFVTETQQIDLSSLAPGTEIIIRSPNDFTAPISVPTTANAIDAQLDALIDYLPAMTTVVETTPGSGIFNIMINEIGDQELLVLTAGGVTDQEIQLIDIGPVASDPNGSFAITFQGLETIQLDSNATPAEVENALNSLATISDIRKDGTGAVFVSSPQPGQYLVRFNVFQDLPSLIATGRVNGGVSARLPGDATAAEVEAALDAVSLYDLTVTAGTVAGTFNIQYNSLGDQPIIEATGFLHERQNIDIFSVGDFIAVFGADSTPLLPANATAQQFEDALNSLASIVASGGVDVTAGPNSSYDVQFRGDADRPNLAVTQFEVMGSTTFTEGTNAIREVQLIRYFEKGAFAPLPFARANIVGAIADFNELESRDFSFIEKNGIPGFNLGDQPIDGIVMARILDQNTLSFTPEARLTAAGFFDHKNVR